MISLLNEVMTSDTIKKIKTTKKNLLINKINLILKIKLPYPLKRCYNSIIPLNIFQTWHTKNLPPNMLKTVNMIKYNNPAFKYYLYDDDDCRNFIKDNFREEVLNAFDTLIPGAYKADLWRYCVLYKLGGIYLDIKYKPLNQFKFITLTEKEHWVLDADGDGIYNAVMVCLPYNEILNSAIYKIVENVKNRYYGPTCLYPTGPGLLSQLFSPEDKAKFDMYHNFYMNYDNRFVYLNNYIIFKSYNGYLHEHNCNKKVDHYSILWGNNKIYN